AATRRPDQAQELAAVDVEGGFQHGAHELGAALLTELVRDIAHPDRKVVSRHGHPRSTVNRIGRSPSASSWPGLSRPSTSLMLHRYEDVDARDKRGHDGARCSTV